MKNKSITRLASTRLALCATLLFTTNSMSAETDTLNAAEVAFVKNEAAGGLAIVKIAELGTQKAIRPEVKTFAAQLVTDHTKVNEELTKLAATKGVELSAVIAPKHAETFQDLEKAENVNFDKEFLSAMVSGHEKCVSNFQETSRDAKDNELRQWATTTLSVYENHLGKARELSSESSASATRPTNNTDRDMRDRNNKAITAADRNTPALSATDHNATDRNTAEGSKTDRNMRNPNNTERNDTDRNTADRNTTDRTASSLTPIDQGNSQSDINTTAQIRKEIIAEENLSVNAQNVKIITNSGKVTLRGSVNTAGEKRIIGEIADRIASAANVDNQLEVQVKTSSN